MKKHSFSESFLLILSAFIALSFPSGCSDSASHSDSHGGHSHGDHNHAPPHGGTHVQLDQEAYHLELVLDSAAGTLLAYVYDGHFHNLVLVPETNFVLQAKFEGRIENLSFTRSLNPATGKLPEKSALFETQAEWLKTVKTFDCAFPSISLGGRSFTNVQFQFPKGTEHVP